MNRWAPGLMLLSLAAAGCAQDRPARREPLPPSLPAVAQPDSGDPSATDAAAGKPDRGPLSLSVEQAAVMALERNRDLRVQRLAPVVAGAFARIARGRYDTELFGRTQVGYERAVETARATEDRFDVRGSAAASRLGARQALSTGTELELAVEHDYEDSSRTPAQHVARVDLTLTQALLQGLGPAVNLAAIEQADLQVQASRYELRGYAEAVLARTEIAYWRTVLAEREIAIHSESLALSKKQRDEIEQEIEVGTKAQTESAAACAEVALREQALIDARAALEQQRLRLLRLLGAALDRPLATTSDPAIAPEAVGDLAERLALADRARAEINEAELRLEQGRLEAVITRNGLLPRLDLFVRLGKTGFSQDFSGSFGNLFGDNFEVLGGISFSHFIQNREAAGADDAALATHRQAELAIANLRQLVQLEVRLAATEVERARQQITASAATRAAQEQKVMVEQERFAVGETTALVLAQAQRDLLESRIAEVEALVDYRVALVQLYLAEGSLLERRGIRLDD